MNESYYIGAYWDSRQESVGDCAERISSLLIALQEQNNIFATWYQLGRSRARASKNKVAISRENIASLMLGRKTVDDLSYTEGIGFRLGLWTGHTDDASASLNSSCGCFAPEVGGNFVTLDLPVKAEVSEELFSIPQLKTIVQLFVEKLDPQWLVVNSRQFRSMSAQKEKTRMIGWMTYTTQELPRLKETPEGLTIVAIHKGSLITVTKEVFTTNNSQHVKIADDTAALIRGQI